MQGGRLMRIGEVARLSGVSVRMLRHYDRLGLVVPSSRTSAGYREYDDGDVRRLFHVESLRTLGMALSDITRVLDEPSFAPTELVDELIEATRQRLAREQRLLDRLRRVRASEPAAWPDVFPVIALLRGLDSDDASRRHRVALESGGRIGPDALAEALLAETDPNVAGALRWALEWALGPALRRSGGVPAALDEALTASDVDIRRRAAEAVAAVGATDRLVPALDDPDRAVRAVSALAVGESGDARAVPALLAMVVEGDRDVEAADVLGALARRRLPAERICTELVALLDTPGVPQEQAREQDQEQGQAAVRVRIVHALAELPGEAPDTALRRLARDPARRVAVTATAVLRVRGAGGP